MCAHRHDKTRHGDRISMKGAIYHKVQIHDWIFLHEFYFMTELERGKRADSGKWYCDKDSSCHRSMRSCRLFLGWTDKAFISDGNPSVRYRRRYTGSALSIARQWHGPTEGRNHPFFQSKQICVCIATVRTMHFYNKLPQPLVIKPLGDRFHCRRKLFRH